MNKEKILPLVFKLISFVLIMSIFYFNAEAATALKNENPALIKKISKDYTNKFCNSIGFGLSKDSAMRFSMEENQKVFKKRKGIKDVNKDVLAEEIALSVIEKCGYPIELSREKGVMDFKEYYLSSEKKYLEKIQN